MPKHIEPLHLGLWNAVDRAFLPEGALQTATNVIYKPGDRAPSQAPGRQAISPSLTVSIEPIDAMVPMYWDPGSSKTEGEAELAQILVRSDKNGQAISPTTVAFGAGTQSPKVATRWPTPSGRFTDYISTGYWDAASMVDRDNGDSATWFVFSGTGTALPERNLVFSRTRYTSDDLVRREPVYNCQIYDDSGATYSDITSTVQAAYIGTFDPDGTRSNVTVLENQNDILYIGAKASTTINFAAFEMYISAHAGTALDVTWEYWNGSAWTSFTPTFDGTLDFNGTPIPAQDYLAYVELGTLSGWTPREVGSASTRKLGLFIRIKRNDVFDGVNVPFPVLINYIKLFPSLINTTSVDNTQHVLSHGLPIAEGALTAGGQTSGGDYDTTTYNWYWWTWYDVNHNKEGAGSAGVAQTVAGTGSNTAAVLNFSLPTTRPPDATHIRLYRGTSTTANVDAFPSGIRLTTVDINGLRDQAHTFTDLGPSTGLTSTAFSGTDTTQFARTAYPLVKINLGGLGTQDSRNGPPPTASTGDVFDESLVLNDVTDPRKLRFSYPGSPHSFPSTFYINFDTKDSDRIVALRSLGNTLAVFMDRSVWRVNWLPRSSDFSFDRGSVSDLVVPNFGAYGHWGVTQFASPGQGPMLAWVGSDGIFMTDNYNWSLLTAQLDWKSMVGAPQNAILVDNPGAYRLECYFAPPGSQTRTYAMYLHYHPNSASQGFMPITLVQRPGTVRAAFSGVTDAGGWQVVTSDNAASLFYEGHGLRDESTPLTTPMDVKTRELYLAGIGEDFKQIRTFAHVKPSGNGADRVVIMTQVEGTGPQVQFTVNTNSGSRRLEAPHQLNYGEYITMRAVVNGAGSFGLNAMGIEFDPQGRKSRG